MIPDNYDIWAEYDRVCANWERRLPTCEECGEPIMQFSAVYIKGDYYCDECLKNMRRELHDTV